MKASPLVKAFTELMASSKYQIQIIDGVPHVVMTCQICGNQKLIKLPKYCSTKCVSVGHAENHQRKIKNAESGTGDSLRQAQTDNGYQKLAKALTNE